MNLELGLLNSFSWVLYCKPALLCMFFCRQGVYDIGKIYHVV
jgi:hypothetical protein